jgi:hypothetical protein
MVSYTLGSKAHFMVPSVESTRSRGAFVCQSTLCIVVVLIGSPPSRPGGLTVISHSPMVGAREKVTSVRNPLLSLRPAGVPLTVGEGAAMTVLSG